jgi:formylmethanofuran dehydrogenase subunit E
MTATDALFVRIRNAEGKYLGGEAKSMSFFDDINKAIVFDCRRDHIEQQLEYMFLTQGIVLEVVPVNPKEIHETCDRCGRLVLSFQAFFDGKQYLCEACRNVGRTA